MKKNVFILLLACFWANAESLHVSENQAIPLASHWILHYFIENGQQVYPDSKSANITISHTLKEFGGFAGCNTIGGKLKTKKSRIRFSELVSTKTICEQNGIENKVLSSLKIANSYKIVGGELFLYKGKKLVLVFESFRN